MPNNDFTASNKSYAANTNAALNSGFLDGLGSQYSNTPIIFDEIEKVLVKYGKLFAESFSKELDNADANATGKLSDTIRFEYTKLGTTYTVTVFMSDYAKFVDEGVQGIGAGNKNTTSPYKFNLPYPSTKQVTELEKWIKAKNVTAIITAPKGIVSKELSAKSLAWAIGTSIKQKGLKATNFKKTVIDRLKEDYTNEIIKAAKRDISISITLV